MADGQAVQQAASGEVGGSTQQGQRPNGDKDSGSLHPATQRFLETMSGGENLYVPARI